MSIVRQCMKLGRIGSRQLYTSCALRSAGVTEAEKLEGYKKLVMNQERFQKEDLVEDVYEKGGNLDVILYRAIVTGTAVALVMDIRAFYLLSLI